MRNHPVIHQHQASTGLARVHAYPCAMTEASWSIRALFSVKNATKPSPRRSALIS